MLSFDEALERILAGVKIAQTVAAGLDDAAGRFLAAPVIAGHDQPPFDGSAMDGYAVHAGSIERDTPYPVVGESQAGAPLDRELNAGEVARIFTGAKLPPGSDAVVIQEDATQEGHSVSFSRSAISGQHVRRTGQDFAAGETLLEPGRRMDAAAIALAAAANVSEVSVYRAPEVALLSTGDELVPVGTSLEAGQIVASNSLTLKALLAPFASTINDLGNAADTEDELRSLFGKALDSDARFIVSTGGASVGDHDLVQPVLDSLGVEVSFWKIAMRPGKPVLVGTKGDKTILALPGNPVSAFVTAALLVVPALEAAGGNPTPGLSRLKLPLAAPLTANGPRRHFIRGAFGTYAGMSAAMPFAQTDSAHLSSLSRADLLIVQPENSLPLSAGNPVECVILPGRT